MSGEIEGLEGDWELWGGGGEGVLHSSACRSSRMDPLIRCVVAQIATQGN